MLTEITLMQLLLAYYILLTENWMTRCKKMPCVYFSYDIIVHVHITLTLLVFALLSQCFCVMWLPWYWLICTHNFHLQSDIVPTLFPLRSGITFSYESLKTTALRSCKHTDCAEVLKVEQSEGKPAQHLVAKTSVNQKQTSTLDCFEASALVFWPPQCWCLWSQRWPYLDGRYKSK